jgi:hypothetical protein
MADTLLIRLTYGAVAGGTVEAQNCCSPYGTCRGLFRYCSAGVTHWKRVFAALMLLTPPSIFSHHHHTCGFSHMPSGL